MWGFFSFSLLVCWFLIPWSMLRYNGLLPSFRLKLSWFFTEFYLWFAVILVGVVCLHISCDLSRKPKWAQKGQLAFSLSRAQNTRRREQTTTNFSGDWISEALNRKKSSCNSEEINCLSLAYRYVNIISDVSHPVVAFCCPMTSIRWRHSRQKKAFLR